MVKVSISPYFIVSDHAIQRYLERCYEGIYGKPNKPSNEEVIRKIYKSYLASDLVKDHLRSYIYPWIMYVKLDENENVYHDHGRRVGLIVKMDGKLVVVKTCFRTICSTCKKDMCTHVQEILNNRCR